MCVCVCVCVTSVFNTGNTGQQGQQQRSLASVELFFVIPKHIFR